MNYQFNMEQVWKDLIDLYNRDHGTNYTVVVTRKEDDHGPGTGSELEAG